MEKQLSSAAQKWIRDLESGEFRQGQAEVTVLAHVHVKMPYDWTEDQLGEFMKDRDLELIMAEEV